MSTYIVTGTTAIEEAYAGWGASYRPPVRRVLAVLVANNEKEIREYAAQQGWVIGEIVSQPSTVDIRK